MKGLRVYGVADGKTTRLVKAASQAQALRHVAKDTYTVGLMSALETAELMSKGVKLESAAEESAEEPTE